MREKLRAEEGKALYGRRDYTIEPVFGIIMAAMRIRGFSLGGKEKVSGEWTLQLAIFKKKAFLLVCSIQAKPVMKPINPRLRSEASVSMSSLGFIGSMARSKEKSIASLGWVCGIA